MEALSVAEIAKAVGGTVLCGDKKMQINEVSTNSKKMEGNALFVPIVGERVDAHDFIRDAFENGAKACFTSRNTVVVNDMVTIAVEDTLKALQALGAYYRNRFTMPVIGITGSVGKTTTKEMVSAALETKFKVLKTEGNMNSQVGLPLMMLRMGAQHEIAVIEMGMSEEGEMSKLAEIARPDTAVMTNIGVSHIAQLKTKENIRKEKLNIINAFHDKSVLFINGNDDLLSELYPAGSENPHNQDKKIGTIENKAAENAIIEEKNTEKAIEKCESSENTDKFLIDVSDATRAKLTHAKITAFGTEDFCDYRAENIETINGETHFILRKKSNSAETMEDDGEEIVLQVLGIHNVYNALAAIAIAEHYQIPPGIAKEGLRNYLPIAMRGQIKECHGLKIIDDSYNASPDSMKSGIQVLLALAGVDRRIAVLADVLELGEMSKECHYEVGTFIADQNIEALIAIGSEAFYIAKGVEDKNKNILTRTFATNAEAIEFLKSFLKEKDGILVKGSRGMKTDDIVKALETWI
jgi:UDP-N-acetylmuramoyl-tripeptide--D-alanyl-D-alanine ligase